jgi:hypothetical protein
MRTVLVSILALVLGVVLGWRHDHDPAPSDGGVDEQVGNGELPVITAEGRARADQVLGQGWRGWADRVRVAGTQEELQGLCDALMATGDGALKKSAGKLLGARWAEVDPAAGTRFLSESKDRAWVLYPLLTDWVLRDREAALAGLGLMEKYAANNATDEVLKRLIRRDPDASLAFMRATWRYVQYHNESEWAGLARARPDEFAALVVEIETDNLERGQSYQAYALLRVAARELAARNPQAALEWADGLHAKMREGALRSVLGVWVARDPKTVVAQVAEWKESGTGPSPLSSMTLFLGDQVARSLAMNDPDAGAEWVKGNWMAINQFAEILSLRMAKGNLSSSEVFDAIAPVNSHNDTVRKRLFPQLWNRMSREELEGTFDVLQAKPAGGPRTMALAGVAGEMMNRNPAQAAALLQRVPPGPDREAVIRKMFAGSSHADSTVEAVAAALPAEERSVAISALFAKDPSSPNQDDGELRACAYAAAMEAVPASPARTKAVERLALHWGSYDPTAAMQWAAELPGNEAVAATGAVARGWAPQDAFALAGHVTEMPVGETRDAATMVLVDAGREHEPDVAWAWTAHIDDPAIRGEARQSVMKAWAELRPEEARAVLDAADLPVGEREALRAILP